MASMCQLLDDGMVGSCTVGVHGVGKNGSSAGRGGQQKYFAETARMVR